MTNGVQVIDYETGNTLILNRRTIIAVERVKVMPKAGSSPMIPKVRVRCHSNLTYILDLEPTPENMASILL